MGIFQNIKAILADFWARVHQHSDPADVYLAELDSLQQLEPKDALELIVAIQDLLLRGEIPGPEEKTNLLRARLAELYSQFSAQSSQIEIAKPEGLGIDTHKIEQVEALLTQARESLNYKVKQWSDKWTLAVDERFGRKGSPFFAVGGTPQPFMNKVFGVARITAKLYSFVMTNMNNLERIVDDVKNRGGSTSQLETIPASISRLYAEYVALETTSDQEITTFMNTFDRFLGMANVTNLINQWTFGKIFMLIDKVVGNPIKWLARLTQIGKTPNYANELRRLTELQKWAKEAKHVYGYEQYGIKLGELQDKSITNMLIHGVPKAPLPAAPAPPVLSKEIVGYIARYGKLPAGFTEGWSPELLAQANKLMRGGMAVSVISAGVKANAEAILDRAIPGGLARFEKDSLQAYVEAGGSDIYGQVDAWLAANATALEEAITEEVVKVAGATEISSPGIPTIEYAKELDEARRNAWIQRVLSYYKGIGAAREYAMLVQLLQELEAERDGAQTQEDLAWVDGLIGSAEDWITVVANEQGIHPELGARRAKNEFQTQMKVGTK